MAAAPHEYDRVLARAAELGGQWVSSLPHRRIAPLAQAAEIVERLGGPLPADGCDAESVLDLLADGAEPGLTAIPAGRFFGWVMGGTLPAALAADWLVSAWDQNVLLRRATPAAAAIEEVAGTWLLDLLGLPADAAVGFVTGATMANLTGLAAARGEVLARCGWDVHGDGLAGAPRVQVLVGRERHETVDLSLRYLGLGRPVELAADRQGRLDLGGLARALDVLGPGEPVIVCLQAGNVHSGAFDPMREAIELAHRHGAWVHVDGAFGLWAAAAPGLRHLVAGVEGADSWATDAHKTLNVPHDCGIAVVADPSALRAAMGMRGGYLIVDDTGPGDPHERVPELSRRARGVPVWAALRSLGQEGVAALVERLCRHARTFAEEVRTVPGAQVLNDVVFTQVCVSFGDDRRTREVTERLLAEGRVWMSGSRWQDREVLRISVSNWSTDEDDVRRSVEALRRAAC